MFAVGEWLFGLGRSNNNKKHANNHHDSEEEEEEGEYDDGDQQQRKYDYNDEYEDNGEWQDDREPIGEYDEDDYIFFEKLETAHQFYPDELLGFYHTVREAYVYELISTNVRNIQTFKQSVNAFVQNFLGYIFTQSVNNEEEEKGAIDLRDIQTQRTYPRLMYQHSNDKTQSLLASCIDDECYTFRIDRRLDFVYAYVLEKGILDTLKKKGDQLIQYQSPESDFIEGLLIDIETLKETYRRRVNSQYVDQVRQSMLTPETMSDSWVIYTRRSSVFFQTCMAFVKKYETDTNIVYSYETLRIEPIPFQQVLLLCGTHPGFIETCILNGEQKESPITVNTEVADDWVSVPIWFTLFYRT